MDTNPDAFVPIAGYDYGYDYAAFFRRVLDRPAKVQIQAFAELAKQDLFFLLVFGLRRRDVNRPWIVDRIREVEACHNNTMDLWAREHYKLLDCDTPVRTTAGWKRHGDLDVGDWVFALDGAATPVVARTPNWDRMEGYRLRFTDGTSVLAGRSHLWLVMEHSRKREGYRRVTRFPAIRSTGFLAQIDHDRLSRAGRRIAIPSAAPVVGIKVALPVPPYTLGVWLGDGTTESGSITKTQDGEIWTHVAADGFVVAPPVRKTRTVYGLAAVLRRAGLLGNKHVPASYFGASVSQRLALLQGLMDTDGHCNTRGTATFCTTLPQLAENVRELVASLGMHASLRRHVGSWNSSPYPYFQVSFQAYANWPVFRLPRKLARCKTGKPWGRRYLAAVDPCGQMTANCIQVAHPSGTYLAGRDLVPTHNSTVITLGLVIQDLCKNPEERIGIFSHTRPIAKGFLRQIKLALESDCPVKKWFPHVFWMDPKKHAPKWSEDDGLIVRRRGQPKESSIEAWGLVDGQPTSKHFTIRVYDDVVTKESVTTPEMIKKTRDAFELSQSLGTDGGQVRICGTHYHFADLYTWLKTVPVYTVRQYPATADGTPTGNPVLMSRARLEELRVTQGPYVFSCHGAGTRILMADWSVKKIEDVKVGEFVVGFDQNSRGLRTRLVATEVVSTMKRTAMTVESIMATGKRLVHTDDHKWFTGRSLRAGKDLHRPYASLGFDKHQIKGLIKVVDLDQSPPSNADFLLGRLSGLYDGEGSCSSNAIRLTQCAVHNPEVTASIHQVLVACGFDYGHNCTKGHRRGGTTGFWIRGGRQARFNFLKWCRPAKSAAIIRSFYQHDGRMAWPRREMLVSQRPVGFATVYNIQTVSGNYVAEGFASKNCQQLLNPVADGEQNFQKRWLRWYATLPTRLNRYLVADPANEKGKKSDYTVIAVVGVDASGNRYLLDMVRARLSLGERWAVLRDMVAAWPGLLKIGYEKYGMQADIAYFEERQRAEGFYFAITPLAGAVAKIDRIRRLVPVCEDGRFYLPPTLLKAVKIDGTMDLKQDAAGVWRQNGTPATTDMIRQLVEEEYSLFPFSGHDDMMDCLSRIEDPDMGVRPPAQECGQRQAFAEM